MKIAIVDRLLEWSKARKAAQEKEVHALIEKYSLISVKRIVDKVYQEEMTDDAYQLSVRRGRYSLWNTSMLGELWLQIELELWRADTDTSVSAMLRNRTSPITVHTIQEGNDVIVKIGPRRAGTGNYISPRRAHNLYIKAEKLRKAGPVLRRLWNRNLRAAIKHEQARIDAHHDFIEKQKKGAGVPS